jgi:hypothetical protein
MRRRLIAAFCILIAAVAADWAVCAMLMSSMRTQFKHWAANLRHQGFAVSYHPLRASVAPWRVRLVVPELSVSGGKAMLPGGLKWRAERLDLSISLFDPDNIAVAPSGDQFLQAAGTPAIVFFAETLTATVPSGLARPDEIRVEAEGLVAGLAASPQRQDVRIETLQCTLQAARGGAARTSARLGIAARGIGLPDDGRWPLGATIGRLDTELSLASPALSGDAPAEQARAWRDWGGVLTVQSLSLHWGPLELQGAAELGLDAHLQPNGRGEARVAGWAATLDALARGGTIQPGVAQTAKAVLALMAHPAQNDAAGESLELPFTLQDSTMSVGKIPLMRFGEVVWGGS